MAKVNMPSKRETFKKAPQVKPVEIEVDVEVVDEVEEVRDNGPILLAVANCKTLNVRLAPSKDSNVVCVIPVNTIVQIDSLSPNSSWLHILGFGSKEQKSPNSKAGYILAEYTSEV